MKIKFNYYERVAGSFVLIAIIGVFATALSAAIQQGWFEAKTYYSTIFENADGVRDGTQVQISGLKVGSVESVSLDSRNRIHVKFYVLSKFRERMRVNSYVQLLRPFIIGERIVDISVGGSEFEVLPPLSYVKSQETMDLMSLMGGKSMSSSLERLGGIFESLNVMLDAFKDKKRAKSLVRVIDRLDPLLLSIGTMSEEVTKLSQQATQDKGIQKLVRNLNETTSEMNKILPELNEYNPTLARDMATVTKNLALVMRAMGPAAVAIEDDLPATSQRLVEVLNETGVLLKAMQKSIFIRGNVREVRQEESLRRMPAQQKEH